jgi:hypothetical protein
MEDSVDKNYEINNPEIRALLRAISEKIKPACPEGWGFLLFLFEFGAGKSNFYMSNADRKDAIKMLREWLVRQEGAVELNAEHPTTSKLHDQWVKIVAILLHKSGLSEFVITPQDIEQLAASDKLPTVMADDQPDGLHLKLIGKDEAEQLMREQDEHTK